MSSGLGRGAALVSASSLLVPVVGVLTAPILTQALGVEGRGELGAALAPYYLLIAIAPVGFPEALTYFVARQSPRTKVVIVSTIGSLLMVGILGVVFGSLAPFLASGSYQVETLIRWTGWMTIATTVATLARGVCLGLQAWGVVAAERLIQSLLRIGLLALLFFTSTLDLTSAFLVTSLVPGVSGILLVGYVVCTRSRPEAVAPSVRELTSFALRVWIGSVASILLARLATLLFVPLSNAEQLGLFIVATTIADVPLIVSASARDVLFGFASRHSDESAVFQTSRVLLILAVPCLLVLALTLPLWVGPVFGPGFDQAIVPTMVLLAAACVAIPGMIAGAGLSAEGQPGLRSVSLLTALVANIGLLVLLVPAYGATGGAISVLGSNLVASSISVGLFSVRRRASPLMFVLPSASDFGLLRSVSVSVWRRRFR